MNRKVIDMIFAFLIFSLPFKYIPHFLWQTILGGPFGRDLVAYPIFIGFIYTLYCQWRYRSEFYKWGIFKKFIIAYVGVIFVSLAWGLLSYPYYDQILSGPMNQIEKLPKVLAILNGIGIPISQTALLKFWMFARPIKGVFFDTFYTFCASYMIYCWYHDRVQRAIEILLRVTTIDLVIIAAYGLVDVFYQNGQIWAQNLLAIANPLLHADVSSKGTALGYFVNLFWDSQNRSIFQEPSYFGIYMSFASPVLWWNIIRTHGNRGKIALVALYTILAFEIFLTQSRMALSVNLGIFVLFAAISIYHMKRKLLLLLVVLIVGGSVSFIASMQFMQFWQIPSLLGEMTPLATRWQEMQEKSNGENYGTIQKGNKGVDAKMYFNENLKSISGDDKNGGHAGSNHTRLTIILTNLEIGKEHPIFGVGTSLRIAYLRDKLDKDPGEEIQRCNRGIDQNGILKGTYGNLGDYAVRFAETGILGLLLFLLPALVLLLNSTKLLLTRQIEVEVITPLLFSLLSFIGIMITGLSDGLNYTFCGWLMLAMGYMIYQNISFSACLNK